MLASTNKNTPTYLNCQISWRLEEQLQKELRTTKFYKEEEVSNNDDDDAGDVVKHDEEEVIRFYKAQFDKNSNRTHAVPQALPVTSTNRNQVKRRIVRSEPKSPPEGKLGYEWFKDGEKISSSTSEENQLEGFTLFSNGTLKFQATNLTAGEYRCSAKYIDNEGKFTIGPIVSEATIVEIASEFPKDLLLRR